MADDRSPYFGEGVLALADGRVFRGLAFGARATRVGEVVFNTSLTGYQEIITDPSYAGQLVCLTVAEVGNVGVNPEDAQSKGAGAEGLVIRSLSPVVSNWRAQQSLPAYLEERGMPGLGEVDTRALTRHLRSVGAVMGALSTEESDAQVLVRMAREAPPMEGQALAHRVSTAERYEWSEGLWQRSAPEPDVHVVAYDFGIKLDILRNLVQQGIRVTVVPSTTPVDEVLALRPDGVFLSNGPGDPAALQDIIERTRELVDRDPRLPIFGICLGHQLMCLALGGRTFKLKFGHHGGNHPVRDERSRSVAITAQNHGFAVDPESLGKGTEVTHLNLFDQTVAGLGSTQRPLWGVQYHPEAAPGPHDAAYLFSDFASVVRRHRAER
ncbi:MAG: glutamine-hydrolyzing carbamoyl-phosphate synthase small subunit [Myxococcales bacterium]|nr:glutamine-hydrolyzing carbamoyl-phosphate synthase small subunit [Myxococcales bacterium]MCB9713924.1 glutamine-hydrolyzing carbamoyl-phosphate synthase small subunit [Myxococcales bacterium]